VGSLVAWSNVTNHFAAMRTQCLADEHGEHDRPASSVGVASRLAGTAWLKNDPHGASAATASRPVFRQSV
jgi:hypothetical protein